MVLLTSLLALTPDASACGGFFPPAESFVASNTQEVIFTPGDGEVLVEYRVLAQGDATNFGWIIPIPGAFVELLEDDAANFEELRELTAPEESFEEHGGGMGCGLSADYALSAGGERGGVDVVASGFAGAWEYTALEATSSDALVLWLEQHGYSVGPSGPSLEAYVAEGGWQFVAISLAAEQAPEGMVEAPPVAIRYAGERIAYPARMSRYSQGGAQHTVIYVLGEQRARISDGWAENELPLVWEGGESQDYVVGSLWPEELARLGADRGYATVFAGERDGTFITRFETIAAPEVHTADVDFAVDAGSAEMHTLLSNETGCDKPEGTIMLQLAALGLLWRRARR